MANLNRTARSVAFIGALLALCACGGGGSNSVAPAPPPAASPSPAVAPPPVTGQLYQADTFQTSLAGATGESCLSLPDPPRRRLVPVQVRIPSDAPGPRPIIVFSHGGGPRDICSFGNSEWGTVLSRAGYVVVHISHNLDAQAQSFACAQIGRPGCTQEEAMRFLRPGDAQAVIDQLATIAAHFALAAVMDTARVAMAGHSFGAYTAMTIAGARYDLGNSSALSSEDRRLRSALALSPQGPDRFGFFDRGAGGNSWSAVSLPVMTQTGANDITAAENVPSRRVPFQLMPPPDKAEVFISDPRAEHSTFNLTGIAAPPEFFDWITSSAIAWFDATLQERAAAWTWLESDALGAATAGVAQLSRKALARPAGP